MGSKERRKKRKQCAARMKEWGKLNANKPTREELLEKARKLMAEATLTHMMQEAAEKQQSNELVRRPPITRAIKQAAATKYPGPRGAKG